MAAPDAPKNDETKDSLSPTMFPHADRLTPHERRLAASERVNMIDNATVHRNKRIWMAQEVAQGKYKIPKQKYLPHAIIRCQHTVKERLQDYITRLRYGTIVPTPNESSMLFVQCSNGDFGQLFKRLAAKESSRRVCVSLHGVQAVTGTLADIVGLDFSAVESLRLMVHPKALVKELLDALPLDVKLAPKNASHVLSVCMAYRRLYYALVPAEDQIFPNRNTDELGVTSWHTLVSKAFNKLNEVVELEDHPFEEDESKSDAAAFTSSLQSLLKRGTSQDGKAWALDIGASPGGWSAVLSERGINVIAVDPGEMSIPDLPSLTGRVVHVRKRIEDALDDIKTHSLGSVDMIVCDMNQHPQRSAYQVLICSQLLRPGGLLVLTCKMLVQGQSAAKLVCDQTYDMLSCRFHHIQQRFLLNNTNRERTILAVRKPDADCTPLPDEAEARKEHVAQLKVVKEQEKSIARERGVKKRERKEKAASAADATGADSSSAAAGAADAEMGAHAAVGAGVDSAVGSDTGAPVSSVPTAALGAQTSSPDALTGAFRFLPAWIQSIISRILRTPIAQFYVYLFRSNKRLFFANAFVNYGLPAFLEMMPWYLSQSKLSRELRQTRNHIEHALMGGKGVWSTSIWAYLGMSVLYAFTNTVDLMFRNRVDLAVRLTVKRMVMERILYSEVGSLQLLYRKYMKLDEQADVRTEDIESRLFGDISMTMHLFNFIVPAVVRGSVGVYRQAWELYADRSRIDAVAILRPTIVSLIVEACNELRLRYVDEAQVIEQDRTTSESSRVVSNIVDGLAEVQVNNLQESQLCQLDDVARREVSNKEGWLTFTDRIYRNIRNRNVLDFVSEIYVVNYVMAKHNMDHETYRKVQNDIDHVFRQTQRVYSHVRQGVSVWEKQRTVIALLNLPSFAKESDACRTSALRDLRELCVQQADFRFRQNSPAVLSIKSSDDGTPAMRFERGKIYSVLGQNQSGKSTLVKLICRLLSAHPLRTGAESHGAVGDLDTYISDEVMGFGAVSMTVNGQDLTAIPRSQFRSMVSYVAQRPFVFPGSIEDNIRVGRADASDEEVLNAAHWAGLILNTGMDDARVPAVASAYAADMKSANAGVSPAKPWEQSLVRSLWKYVEDSVSAWLPAYNSTPGGSASTANGIATATSSIMEPDTSAALWTQQQQPEPEAKRPPSPQAPDSAHLLDRPTPAEEARLRVLLRKRTDSGGSNLSGGLAQSVALARIFLRQDAQLLILDEAMSSMDTIKKREHVIPRVLRFARRHNMTVIIISHDVATVGRLCDQVYVLSHGAIVHQGTHEELVKQKATEYVRLLGT